MPSGPCTLQVDLPNSAPFAAGFTDGIGAWNLGLPIPGISILIGSPVVAQAFVVGLGGPMLGAGDLSNGLQLVLGL